MLHHIRWSDHQNSKMRCTKRAIFKSYKITLLLLSRTTLNQKDRHKLCRSFETILIKAYFFFFVVVVLVLVTTFAAAST
jgi:hypothetical protein